MMIRHIIRTALFIILTITSNPSFSQNFPVRVTPILTPPYTPFLTDYAEVGSDKLTLQVILNDITVSNYHCKLRLSIDGVNISITTRPDYIPNPLILQGGSPEILYGSDLTEYFNPVNLVYKGITQKDIEKNGNKLPEGIYRFTFEVLDYNRNLVVSNKGTATAWMLLNDPPFINLPFNNAKVKPIDPQNITFQWTPRHRGSPNSAFTTAYEVKLFEIWPKGRNPFDAVNSSQPVYEIITDANMVVYGSTETPLILGREYALQVRAKDTGGRDLFRNNGYSEVIKFTYGDECPAPVNVQSDEITNIKARLKWQGNVLNTGYAIRYREKKEGAEWFDENTEQLYFNTTGLRSGTTYEYQLAGQCLSYFSEFTTQQTLTTLTSNPNAFVCGNPTVLPIPDGSPPLPALFTNDSIKAGGFSIIISTAVGTNGKFSGTGQAVVPWFNNARIRITFENITVNKSYQLTSGVINSVWDKDSELLKVPEQVNADIKQSSGFKSDVATFEADSLINVKGAIVIVSQQQSNGNIVVTKSDGSTITLEKGKSYAIADEVGNGYLVDKEGNIKKTSAADAIAAAEKGNREYATDAAQIISFSKADSTKYGLDNQRDGTLIENYQQTENEKYVSWKALAANQSEIIQIIPGENTDLSKVKFKVEGLTSQELTPNSQQLTVQGKPNGTNEELLAVVSSNDTTKDGTILGKLNLISYDEVHKKLVIVLVNKTTTDLTGPDIQASLNEIYRQAVASWTVNPTIQQLNVSGIDETNLDDGGSGLLSTYTSEMKQVLTAFLNAAQLEADTYYLFLVTNSTSGSKLGYMPRNKQAGFIFTGAHLNNNQILHTMAHELGHGAFHLQHTFSEFPSLAEGTTDNLMDYRDGTVLNKYQWDNIHNPERVIGLFADDDEGAYETDGHYSTVYLVSLLLGMDKDMAQKLAIAAEAPDTDVHSELEFELDQTWSYPMLQQEIHSLTGGFHGVEEMMTAFKLLWAPQSNTESIGELLHRYGDTYAHTKLDNIFPEALKDYQFKDQDEKLTLYVNSWRDQGGLGIQDRIEPWIQFINNQVSLHGYNYLFDERLQRMTLNGNNLVEYLHNIYLNQPIDKLLMYGNGFFTLQHASKDKGIPDFIYVRPRWYLTYVKNLAVLLSYKYDLNISAFNTEIFERMVNFSTTNQCKLKGIIDFEIARTKNEKYFYIPVFYSKSLRIIASGDAVFMTNYLAEAKSAKEFALKYMTELGFTRIEVKEINGSYKINSSDIFQLQAYLIKF